MNENELMLTIEQTNAMLDRKGLDSEFFRQMGIAQINIPGVKGYVTPISSEHANHVGLSNLDENDADDVINRVIDFFAGQKKSFSWIVGPTSKPKDLPERLVKHNFVFNDEISEYGMALSTAENMDYQDKGFPIREITLDELGEKLDLIMESFGTGMTHESSSMLVQMAKLINSTPYYKDQIKAYVAVEENSGKEAGFCMMEMDRKNGYAILDGSAVLPAYRGRGIYRRMVAKRKNDAERNGIEHLIIHALKKTSAPVCENVGFRKICELNMYVYRVKE